MADAGDLKSLFYCCAGLRAVVLRGFLGFLVFYCCALVRLVVCGVVNLLSGDCDDSCVCDVQRCQLLDYSSSMGYAFAGVCFRVIY